MINIELSDAELGLQRRRIEAVSRTGDSLVSEFSVAARAIKSNFPKEQRVEAITRLGNLFCNMIEGKSPAPLVGVEWAQVFDELGFNRLKVVEACSRALSCDQVALSGVFGSKEICEDIFPGFIAEALKKPLKPERDAHIEVPQLLRRLPEVVEHLSKLRPADALSLRTEYRTSDIAVAALHLVTCYNMSADVAIELIKIVSELPNSGFRETVSERFFLLARERRVEAITGDDREPFPLGRAAFLAAIKQNIADSGPDKDGTVHHFTDVEIPKSKYYWDYMGQRLRAISHLHDPKERAERIYQYSNLIVDSIAALPFTQVEERFFRGRHLEGANVDPAHLSFYSEIYGVDNGPGADRSPEAAQALQDTSERFRHLAAIRYSLNTRKGYARTLESGKWLLEEMAEEVGGIATRLRVQNIERYPGPGVVLSGLDVRRAIDLSSHESRLQYFEMCPWLRTGDEVLHETDLYFTRGWIAAARSFELREQNPKTEWKAVVNSELM